MLVADEAVDRAVMDDIVACFFMLSPVNVIIFNIKPTFILILKLHVFQVINYDIG